MIIFDVVLSKQAQKDLKKVPSYIETKLKMWIELVDDEGLHNARKIPGFHDEPLKGKRKHQRSIRLSKSYRAIYEINDNNEILFVEIMEINHHEY